MRKYIFGIVAIALMALVGIRVSAENYTVELTTYGVAGTTTSWGGYPYPLIKGGVKIDKIIIRNASITPQTIKFYSATTSTTTATEELSLIVSSSTTLQVPFDYYNPLVISNIGVNKSSTADECDLNLIYR